jgi:class 3 adenylate cyclase
VSASSNSTLDAQQQVIADLRRQLAERTAERDAALADREEARAQQTATAEVLGVINASPGDLAPVFDAMLERAMSLCEADYGHVYTFDEGQFSPAAIKGDAEFISYRQKRGPIRPQGDGTSALERLVAGESVTWAADVRTEQAYETNARFRELADTAGIRSMATVALRKADVLLGAIVVYRRQVQPFPNNQIVLLQNFAAQAVIAMENARLLTEMREALEQQTATAEVLQVINGSPGDLAPVFGAMLAKAVRLCEFPFAALWTYDGARFAPVAFHNMPAAFEAYVREHTPPGIEALRGAPGPIHFKDVFATELARRNPGFAQKAQELGGVRTLLLVPLRKDRALLGTFVAYRQEVRPFTEKQIALLENFAAQAVIAMENARLITETREALEQQTATAEVLGVINSCPGDLAPVFEAMLEKATRLCNAPFGQLAIYDGELFRFVAAHGEKAFALNLQREPHPASDGVTWLRILGGEDVVHVPDVRDTDLYRSGHLRTQEFVDKGRGRSLLSVALHKDKTLLGVLSIYRQEPQPFTDKQIALLQNFAAQAVIAMENARLLGELRQRTEEVAELNRGLEARVAEQVEELGRVGRLKRFLAPQLAELIVSQGDEKVLESHRREIVVVFCDLRGYTAFTETAEPEEVLDFLREYHGALGPLVSQFEGTLDQFSGDGIMVFFNDPIPVPDPAERAVRMSMAMREAAGALIAEWRERGRDLGFGAGIAQGYATLGQIGFSERSGYTAIGTVCNVAARLCAEAKDGQILLSQRVNVALKGSVVTEQVGALALKGLTQPVVAYNVPLAATQPALRVIDGRSPSV